MVIGVGAGLVTAVGALSALAIVVIFCCGGAWALFGPVNYFGCGVHRPSGITEADLVGTYATDDGGRLTLNSDGSSTATSLDPEPGFGPQSGSGDWQLLQGSEFGDVELSIGTFGMYLDIAGSRREPWLYWYDVDPDLCRLKRLNRV